MADFFRATLSEIAETMKTSFCADGTYPWVQEEKLSVDHRPIIPVVLSMVFGKWCVSGGVRKWCEPRDRINVYLPVVLSDGKTSCERGKTKVCSRVCVHMYGHAMRWALISTVYVCLQVVYASTKKAAVYVDSSTTVNDLVQEFVDCIARHGFFDARSPAFFLPGTMIVDIGGKIVDVIMGDQRREARPQGPKSRFSAYGMKQVPAACRSHWAFGTKVMVFPEPIEPQSWNDIASRGEESGIIPQIKIVEPSSSEPPYIPVTRHFDMNEDEEAEYQEMVETICGSIAEYATRVYPRHRKDKDTLRQWISDQTFRLLHTGYYTSFMSFIGKSSADICVVHARSRFC